MELASVHALRASANIELGGAAKAKFVRAGERNFALAAEIRDDFQLKKSLVQADRPSAVQP